MKSFRLAPWARVRQEDFGLLFYDTRSTTMTYVRCGDLLSAPTPGDASCGLGIRADSPEAEKLVERALRQLEAKGLVVVTESF
jgi:putative mycofactocin binding protein MftB